MYDMRSMMRRTSSMAAIAVAVLGITAGRSSDDAATSATKGLSGLEAPVDGSIGVQVASYEPVAEARDSASSSGWWPDKEIDRVPGTVPACVAHAAREAPLERTTVAFEASGTYRLVAGQEQPANMAGPRFISPSDGLGVYGTDVTFDRAGDRLVRVTARVDGEDRAAEATFEVRAKASNPFPGEAAPAYGEPAAG